MNAAPQPEDDLTALRHRRDALEQQHQAEKCAWADERAALVSRIGYLTTILGGRVPKAAPALLRKPVDAGVTASEA